MTREIWIAIGVAVVALALFVLFRSCGDDRSDEIRRQLDAEKAKLDDRAKAGQAQVDANLRDRLDAIDTKYREALHRLSESEREKAERLRRDPKALSRFLEDLSDAP